MPYMYLSENDGTPRDPPGVKLRMTGTEIRTEDSPVTIALIWPARPAQGSLNLTPPDSFTGRVDADQYCVHYYR